MSPDSTVPSDLESSLRFLEDEASRRDPPPGGSPAPVSSSPAPPSPSVRPAPAPAAPPPVSVPVPPAASLSPSPRTAPSFADLAPVLETWASLIPPSVAPPSLAAGVAVLESLADWAQLLSTEKSIARDALWIDPLELLVRSEVAAAASVALDAFLSRPELGAPPPALVHLAEAHDSLVSARPHYLVTLQYLLGLVDIGSPEVARLKRVIERLQGGAFVSASQSWVAHSFPVLRSLYDSLARIPGIQLRSTDLPWPPAASLGVPPVFALVCGEDTREQADLQARRILVYDDQGQFTRLSLGGTASLDADPSGADVLLVLHPHSIASFPGPPPFYALLPSLSSPEHVAVPAASDYPASIEPFLSALSARSVHVLVLHPPDFAPPHASPVPELPPEVSLFASDAPLPVLVRHCLRLLGVESLFESIVAGDPQ